MSEYPEWIRQSAAHIFSVRGQATQQIIAEIILDRFERASRCIVCFGHGRFDGSRCPNCRGFGRVCPPVGSVTERTP